MFSVFAIAMAILALQALFTVFIVTAFVGGTIGPITHIVASYIAVVAVGVLVFWCMPSFIAILALLTATWGVDYAIRQFAVSRVLRHVVQRDGAHAVQRA